MKGDKKIGPKSAPEPPEDGSAPDNGSAEWDRFTTSGGEEEEG